MTAILSRRLPGVVTLLAGVLLAACQTTPPKPGHGESSHKEGEVSYSELPAASAAQYKLKQSEHAFGAQPISNDPPVYPEQLVGKALPTVTVRVKAIVDDSGSVTEVRDLDASSDTNHQAFLDACRTAVTRWKFSPMTIVQESDDGRGNISQVRKNAAFSRDYAFRFEIVDGKPRVSSGLD